MAFKILSDFDGVWTDQAIEAECVKLFLAAEAARLAGVPANQALAEFRAFEVRVLERPERYGWAPDGRITAYVDEDLFCVANAVAALIAEGEDRTTRRYRSAILDGGFDSVPAFADRCFLSATANYREQHPPALVPGAKEHLEAIGAAGAQIVVVSNSPADKIIRWFRAVGVDAGESEGHLLRVRGAAGKQTLGESDDKMEVAGRCISVDRPLYRAVLREERPDLVIGDVFSLDLALPHVLRERGAEGAPRTLVLRGHSHTPDWVRRELVGGPIDHEVGGVEELVPLVRALAGAATRP
jgi:phosphoglycolate phosphatase-like HAD superfamily hydrolase